jgi:PAS domain S-box-containing protein
MTVLIVSSKGAGMSSEFSYEIFDSFNFPVCVIGMNGELISRNGEFERLFEPVNGSVSIDWTHPFFPEYRKKIAISYLRALKGQEKQCFAVMGSPNNGKIPVEIYLFPMFSGKAVFAILVFMRMVEDRMNSFDESMTSYMEGDSAGNSRMYEFSPYPIIRINREGEIVSWSNSMESFTGYGLQGVNKENNKLSKIFSHYDYENVKKVVNDIYDGRISFKRIGDVKVIVKDKEEKWVNAILYPIVNEGKIEAVETIIEDITKIKSFENKLSLSNRIQLIGDITKGLLHSFNNIINVILSRTQMLLQITEKDIVLEGLRTIEKTANEGVKQIRRIEDFVGEGGRLDETEEENLIDVLEDAIEFAKIQFKVEEKENRRSIKIEKKYYSKIVINTNTRLLRELLLSTIFKVSNYITKEGIISIVLKNGDNPCLSVSTEKDTEKCETDPEAGAKYFHQVDIRRIAEKINMKIIEEESSGDYAIKAIIPQSMITEKDNRDTESVDFRIRGLDIIIVEDEEDLKEILFELFNNMGNRVSVYDNGDEALEEFKSRHYDILITDYGIKGITGIELAARAKEIDEKLMTVLLSGWMLDDLKSYKNVIDIYFPKPFKLEVLITGMAKFLMSRKK